MSLKPNPVVLAAIGILFALLSWFVYSHEDRDAFEIYVIGIAFWTGLFGYCVWSRRKRTRNVTARPR